MLKLSKSSKTNTYLERQSGQALLIVLLSMAVVLTVVLSVLSSSITDVAVTSREEEALRAFSAAEAGVEKALIVGESAGDFDQAAFNATVASVSEGSQTFNYPQDVSAGSIASVWFSAHDEDGNIVCNSEKPCFTGNRIKVCWGKTGSPIDANSPAIEATVFYLNTPGSYSTARVARSALDPNSSRILQNYFTQANASTCTIDGKQYAYQSILDFSTLGIPALSYNTQGGLQYMNLKMVYNTNSTQPFGVDVNFSGNTLLPSQGSKIDSVGTAGEATRKIEVYRLYAQAPSIFTNAVFSSGGISQ